MSSLELTPKSTSEKKEWFDDDQEDTGETNLEQKMIRGGEHNFTDDELNPRRSCIQHFFRLMRAVAIIGSLAMAAGQTIEILFGDIEVIEYILRLYMLIFCLVIILNELTCTRIISSGLLSNWISRGVIYSFVGVVGIDENHRDEYANNVDQTTLTFLKIVAWGMIGCGILYFILGLLCCQIVSKKIDEDYNDRLQKALHIQEALKRTGAKINESNIA